MTYLDQDKYLIELNERISRLPIGSISQKTVSGKTYFYHRWYENGKRIEKYIPQNELETLIEGIRQRRQLEESKRLLEQPVHMIKDSGGFFRTSVKTGEQLDVAVSLVNSKEKRDCFKALERFIYGPVEDRVLVLYGLRRTGKTTLIRQVIAEMDNNMFAKTALIQTYSVSTLSDLNHDLKILEQEGYRYIFIDEVTQMQDFIEGAALLSDVFASSGMKIVLSGTDSLGFVFAEDEQLYDRCTMIHTTFIPYNEWERLLATDNIDTYIRYGGTLRLMDEDNRRISPFEDKKSTDRYVSTAIAGNIQHALSCYQYGGHFRSLEKMYERNELTGAINRIVEDMNHEFTVDVLTREFKSHDLALSAKNFRNDSKKPSDVPERIDIEEVTDRLCGMLEIRNAEEQRIKITDAHVVEIREYLELLDLIDTVDVLSLPSLTRTKRTLIAQPGLRYAQAVALINSLFKDRAFEQLSPIERRQVKKRILSEISGRMLEDIVLLETKRAKPDLEVFVMQFSVGEFDMVTFDEEACTCEIYEIKHSDKTVKEQARHLVDKKKCKMCESYSGTILKKTVLYRGKDTEADGIIYKNVGSYLRELWAEDRKK